MWTLIQRHPLVIAGFCLAPLYFGYAHIRDSGDSGRLEESLGKAVAARFRGYAPIIPPEEMQRIAREFFQARGQLTPPEPPPFYYMSEEAIGRFIAHASRVILRSSDESERKSARDDLLRLDELAVDEVYLCLNYETALKPGLTLLINTRTRRVTGTINDMPPAEEEEDSVPSPADDGRLDPRRFDFYVHESFGRRFQFAREFNDGYGRSLLYLSKAPGAASADGRVQEAVILNPFNGIARRTAYVRGSAAQPDEFYTGLDHRTAALFRNLHYTLLITVLVLSLLELTALGASGTTLRFGLSLLCLFLYSVAEGYHMATVSGAGALEPMTILYGLTLFTVTTLFASRAAERGGLQILKTLPRSVFLATGTVLADFALLDVFGVLVDSLNTWSFGLEWSEIRSVEGSLTRLAFIPLFGLAPALSEEVLYRGYLGGLLRRISPLFAMFLSSVLFAAAHLGYESYPWYLRLIELTFVGGPILYYVYQRYGLRTAILHHYLYNTVFAVQIVFGL